MQLARDAAPSEGHARARVVVAGVARAPATASERAERGDDREPGKLHVGRLRVERSPDEQTQHRGGEARARECRREEGERGRRAAPSCVPSDDRARRCARLTNQRAESSRSATSANGVVRPSVTRRTRR